MKSAFLPAYLLFISLALALYTNGQGGPLPLNSNISGNLSSNTPDVWDITTTTDGLLRLTFTTTSPADLYMTLYDNNGTTVIGGTVESYNNSTVSINADGLLPGTYHVKITPYSTAYGAYTLADSLFTTTVANDAEPNGTAATAIVLPLNGSKTGHLGYYYNNQRDTADWYKVTTSADGLLRVYLSTARGSIYSTNNLDVNMWLYDNDGTTQLGAVEVFNANGPATNMITADGLAPGTYYVKLQSYSTTEFANYTISDSLFTPTIANDAEPNGTAATAVVLPLNGSKTGHLGYYYNNQRDTADWYKVTTSADGLLRVYLSTARGSIYSTNNLDVNMWLYDNDGTTQLGAVEVFNANGPATNMITADGLAPGTYYVKVQSYSTREFANYTISDSLFTPTIANDVEPNGTTATAVVLPLNGSKTGHLGYYYNNQRDTADWYKVTTSADGLLRVYLSTARGSLYSGNNLDVNMWLYDNDGTTQLGAVEVFNANGPATNLITADGLAPGTYYVKVQSYSTTEFANYTISDSLFAPTIASDAEPNSSTATALVFPLNTNAKGHVGYYYNNQRDTADWYNITTPAAGPIHLYLSTQRGSVYSNNALDMILTVYGSDGVTLLGSKEIFSAGGPATDSLNFVTLPAGAYYVKVTNYSSSQFGIYSLIISASPQGGSLPVTFINFDGLLQNNQALLKWSTASEINNKGFDVEKSTDGHTFQRIGFVKGNGNTAIDNNYMYVDNKIVSGYNYYRLKQVDTDGNFKYSSIIRLDFKNFDWKIFGNPVTSNTWVQLQLAKSSNVAIRIITIDGKIIKTINNGTIGAGTYSIPLNLENVSRGIYIVELMADNQVYSKKVSR